MVANSLHTIAPVTSDDESIKRRQILEGARKVFMDLGFDGASMGEIARTAGVSKGTLYVYFADKSRLFEAIVEQECAVQHVAAFDLDADNDNVAEILGQYGRAYMGLLGRPQGGSAIRTVMAIAERMPEVGRRYYEQVPRSWIKKLAVYLERQVQSGRLVIDDGDYELAAAQFTMACQAKLFLPFIFQAAPPPTPEQIGKVVDSATRMFLAAYLPRG